MDLRLRVRAREVPVSIDTSGGNTCVAVDGRTIAVEEFSIGERYVTLRIAGSEYRLLYARCGARLHVGYAGANYTFTTVDDEEESSDVSSDGFVSEITSPMPGKVLDILVASGDTVEPGQALLVLEAMKMEQTIRAAAPARVSEVSVDTGAMIAPGQTLIMLEPEG